MKVTSIRIHNILGIEDFEICPKAITRFEGKNAVGKTSALEAVKAALSGGHDATLLRNGAEEGEIVLVLDDGLEIKKTVTAEETELRVGYPRGGKKMDQPRSYIQKLVDALSVNPVEFLSAPSKDRAKYLLEAMPLKVTVEDLSGIWPNPSKDMLDGHAFNVLAAIEKMIFDDRTGVNRLKDEKMKTAKQLGETLPAEDEKTDWAAEQKEKAQALADARAELKNAKETAERVNKENRAAINTKCHGVVNTANSVYSQAEAGFASTRETYNAAEKSAHDLLESEFQRKLSELNAWKRAETDKICGEYNGKNREIEAQMNKAKKDRDDLIASAKGEESLAIESEEKRFQSDYAEKTDALQKSIAELSARVAEAEANVKRQIKDNATRETIERVLAEAEKHEGESEALSVRLEKLHELRFKILQNLPIPGLVVEDGQIKKNGVVFDRLNTADQIAIAVAIAKVRAKELGIVCVDGLECLDAENFAEFERLMSEAGLQCFVTRVTNPEGDRAMEVVTK